MRPFFRQLISDVLGLKAAMLAGTAASLTDLATAGPFVAIVALLLTSKAWMQSRGENNSTEIALLLKRLSEKHGSIDGALEKLADESETHALIEPAWASDILELLRASDRRIQALRLGSV